MPIDPMQRTPSIVPKFDVSPASKVEPFKEPGAEHLPRDPNKKTLADEKKKLINAQVLKGMIGLNLPAHFADLLKALGEILSKRQGEGG